MYPTAINFKGSYTYYPVPVRQAWTTGVWRRLPCLGLAALVGVILCAAASAAILVYSNQKPISRWQIQPTVWLALLSAAANVALAFALSEGVKLAWCKKAVKGGEV